MSGRATKIIAAIIILAVFGGVIYWYAPWAPAEQQQSPRQRRFASESGPVPVLAVAARTADVPVYLDGVGTARALNTVTVRAQVEGKLINVSFVEGQDVEKGQVLAKIDPTTYQAAYDQAMAKKAQDEATLANARVDLERYNRLAKTNAINKQQVDTQQALVNQLEALVRSDQAAIDSARAVLNYTTITAPIAGRTGIRLVDEGNIVRGSDATGIVVITQIRPVSVLFNLPQQELPEINKGLAEGPLPVTALGPDGKTPIDTGKVIVVDNQVDPTTGTVKLKAEFANARLQIWPGQFVNVRLLIDTLRKVVVIPTAAIQRGPIGTFVYVLKDNTAVVRPVTIRQQDDKEAVIATGLITDERVITTGFARLTDGAQVRVTNPADLNVDVEPQTKKKGRRDRPDGEKRERGEKREKRERSEVPGGPKSTQQP
jgi:multidrug efflux system membrane fusion protein